MTLAFIGIDVAVAEGKHLPIVVSVQQEGRLIPQKLRPESIVPPCGAGNVAVLDPIWQQSFAVQTRRYILRVCERFHLLPARIAVDAPSSPCSHFVKRRAAEVAMDRAGVSCFATPTTVDFELIQEKVKRHLASGGTKNRIPHAHQLWMLAGFAIFKELLSVAECIEVFPQATMRVIGSGQIHKSQPGAVDNQLKAVSRYTGWPIGRADDPLLGEIGWGTDHDRLDAYASSWVASLSEDDRFAFGQPPDDCIWVPQVDGLRPPLPSSESASSLSSASTLRHARARSASASLMCPACDQHLFKRWPWGWDAHAAHKCSGLTALEPDDRKAEFKQRFAEHF
jgi:hypothetical protein